MTGIEIVAKLAELQRQYDDAHRPTRPLEAYRRRHARRHPKLDYDGEQHVSQYRSRGLTGIPHRRKPRCTPKRPKNGGDRQTRRASRR